MNSRKEKLSCYGLDIQVNSIDTIDSIDTMFSQRNHKREIQANYLSTTSTILIPTVGTLRQKGKVKQKENNRNNTITP